MARQAIKRHSCTIFREIPAQRRRRLTWRLFSAFSCRACGRTPCQCWTCTDRKLHINDLDLSCCHARHMKYCHSCQFPYRMLHFIPLGLRGGTLYCWMSIITSGVSMGESEQSTPYNSPQHRHDTCQGLFGCGILYVAPCLPQFVAPGTQVWAMLCGLASEPHHKMRPHEVMATSNEANKQKQSIASAGSEPDDPSKTGTGMCTPRMANDARNPVATEP